MRDDLPRYVSTSGVSVGPMEEAPDIYNQYARIFSDIEQETKPIAENYIDETARQEGEIAGENPGFKPGLPIGRASAEYNAAGLASNKMAITANAINNINTFKNKALGLDENGSPIPGSPGISKESVEEFNANLKAYASGQLMTIPNENRNYFKQYLAAKSTVASSQLNHQLNNKNYVDQTLGMIGQNDTITSSINENLSSGDVLQQEFSKKQLASQIQSLQAYAETNPKGLKLADELIRRQKENFYKQYHLGLFNRALSENDTQSANNIINNVSKSPDTESILGTSGVSTLQNQMRSIMKSRLQDEGVNALDVKSRENMAYQRSFDNPDQTPDQTNNEYLSEYYNSVGNPEKYTEYQEKLSIAQNAGSYVKEASTSSINDITGIESTINKQLSDLTSKKTINPTDAFHAQQLHNALKQVEKIRNTMINDPVSLIRNSKGYLALNQKNSIDPTTTTQDDLDNYIKNSQISQGVSPSNVRLLSNDDVQNFKKQFLNTDDGTKINMINAIASRYGRDANTVFHEIQSRTKLPVDMPLLNEVSQNDQTKGNSDSLLRSMLVGEKFFLPSTTTHSIALTNAASNSVYSNYMDTLHSQGLYTDATNGKLHESAKYARYIEQTENKDPDTAMTLAMDTVLGSHITTPSFQGRKYVIMNTDKTGKNVDSDNVQAAIHYLSSKAIQGKDVIFPKGSDKFQYGIALRAAMAVKNHGNDGWDIDDASGNPIQFKDRNPTITYDEIQNHNSTIMTEVAQDVIKKYGSYSPDNLKKYINSPLPDSPRPKIAEGLFLSKEKEELGKKSFLVEGNN